MATLYVTNTYYSNDMFYSCLQAINKIVQPLDSILISVCLVCYRAILFIFSFHIFRSWAVVRQDWHYPGNIQVVLNSVFYQVITQTLQWSWLSRINYDLVLMEIFLWYKVVVKIYQNNQSGATREVIREVRKPKLFFKTGEATCDWLI